MRLLGDPLYEALFVSADHIKYIVEVGSQRQILIESKERLTLGDCVVVTYAKATADDQYYFGLGDATVNTSDGCRVAQAPGSSTLRQEGLSPEVQSLLARAEKGDARAQLLLATAYDNGTGAPRDRGEAMRWYRAAAEQGDAEAQNSVGSVLQADKDYPGARAWYQKAADQAHPLALNNLAYLYDLGLGVPQDRQRALALYTQAANLGWAESMWNLANMYGAGQVGMVDLPTACVWTLRADKYAQPSDARLRAQFARVVPQLRGALTAEQFATCKADSEAWSPTSTVGGGKKS